MKSFIGFVVFVMSVLMGPIFAHAQGENVFCTSYASLGNGVELKIENGVGVYTQRIIGGRVPTNLGAYKPLADNTADQLVYDFTASPSPLKNFILTLSPSEPISMTVSGRKFTGFKGHVTTTLTEVNPVDGVATSLEESYDMVCNWL